MAQIKSVLFAQSKLRKVELTEDQIRWFGDRISESHTGRVIIPSYLYKKFRKIVDDETLENSDIKCWLIDNIYNT